jgi:hypothetical protein
LIKEFYLFHHNDQRITSQAHDFGEIRKRDLNPPILIQLTRQNLSRYLPKGLGSVRGHSNNTRHFRGKRGVLAKMSPENFYYY